MAIKKNECRWCKNLSSGGGYEGYDYYECDVSTKDCLTSFPFKNTSCKQFSKRDNYLWPTVNQMFEAVLKGDELIKK